MRQASLSALALSLAALGCAPGGGDSRARGAAHIPSKAPPQELPAPPAVSAPSPGDRASPVSVATIGVESFDCFKLEEGSADVLLPTGAGISSWSGGGPGGASWNAAELLCATTVRTTCDEGTIATDFRIGSVSVGTRTVPIQNERGKSTLKLTRSQWEVHLDKIAFARLPYRTAIFRVTASLTCRAPYQLQPGIGPRTEVAADSMFVAGFAYGE